MMVSNRLTNVPAQVVCTEDLDIEAATIPELQSLNGIITTTKQTVSIVELGRRLRKCARLGNTEQVHELMTKGAPFTTDWLGTSALHLAAMNNHLETCEVLLRAGISRDARTKVERTPLHLAAYEGHAKICELLLINKAEVDPRDMLRMTPLHWAVEKQHDAVVELLLQHGANPTLISKFDKTPISIAIELNRLDLAHLLQLAARLLSEQAELANTEENAEDAQATLIATQNLDSEFQQQVDAANIEAMEVLQNHCKTEILDEMPTNENIEETNIEKSPDFHDGIDVLEEPQILKNATAFTSPSQLSTLQLLQEHGITMLPTDEGGLVNNAIQSGRTIVLSEAGKLVLAENKKIDNKPTIPIIKPSKKPIIIPNTNLKNKKVITLTQEQFMAITKSQGNKPLLKKVSAEAFKKAAETAGIKYSMMPSIKSTPVITYSPKLKKLTVIPQKDQSKSQIKVINPVALSNTLSSTNLTVDITSNNTSILNEIETYKVQLKEALIEIEALKAELAKKDLENNKLKEQLADLISKENPAVD